MGDFRFVRGKESLDWGLLCMVDAGRLLEGGVDVGGLQRIMDAVAFAHLPPADAVHLTPQHISHLFTLCQLTIQYLIFSQERLAMANQHLSLRATKAEDQCSASETAFRELEAKHDATVRELKGIRRTLMAYEFTKTYGNAEPSFQCSQCQKVYSSGDALNSHIAKRHTVSAPGSKPDDSAITYLKRELELLRSEVRLAKDAARPQSVSFAPAAPPIVPDYAAMAAWSKFQQQQIVPVVEQAAAPEGSELKRLEALLVALSDRIDARPAQTVVQNTGAPPAATPPTKKAPPPWLSRLSSTTLTRPTAKAPEPVPTTANAPTAEASSAVAEEKPPVETVKTDIPFGGAPSGEVVPNEPAANSPGTDVLSPTPKVAVPPVSTAPASRVPSGKADSDSLPPPPLPRPVPLFTEPTPPPTDPTPPAPPAPTESKQDETKAEESSVLVTRMDDSLVRSLGSKPSEKGPPTPPAPAVPFPFLPAGFTLAGATSVSPPAPVEPIIVKAHPKRRSPSSSSSSSSSSTTSSSTTSSTTTTTTTTSTPSSVLRQRRRSRRK